MGASGWAYVTEYKGDLESSLAALHTSLFDGGETYFRRVIEEWELPQPASLQELWSEPYYEFMGEHGTHSILDVPTMEDITLLSAEETGQTFGTEHPTRVDWDRVEAASPGGPHQLVGERWTGRCVLLFKDDQPEEVAFWGFSGD